MEQNGAQTCTGSLYRSRSLNLPDSSPPVLYAYTTLTVSPPREGSLHDFSAQILCFGLGLASLLAISEAGNHPPSAQVLIDALRVVHLSQSRATGQLGFHRRLRLTAEEQERELRCAPLGTHASVKRLRTVRFSWFTCAISSFVDEIGFSPCDPRSLPTITRSSKTGEKSELLRAAPVPLPPPVRIPAQ